MAWRMLPLVAAAAACAGAAGPDVHTIIERSVQANERDWQAAPQFDYFERDRVDRGTKTYRVHMIGGSTYQELVAVNGKPLPADKRAEEKKRLAKTIEERRVESAGERARRVAQYSKERERDHVMILQLTKAFDFRLVGQQRLRGRRTYVLQATPRSGYAPPNNEAKVLTGMRGRLWIDADTFQWAKVEAEVVQPVSIAGFLAKVEPGTRFELTYAPVTKDIWLPNHFVMRSHAKVVFVFSRRDHADESYYGYEKAASPP